MILEKILAGAIAILIVYVMVPHVKRGEYLAPTPIAPNTWMADYIDSDYAQAMSSPDQGFGMRRIDFWNASPTESRAVTTDDFRIRRK